MDRVLTIPNAISAARLAGVPVFLWLVLGVQTQAGDYWAVALLILAGLSDWLDGKIARALNQGSRLGRNAGPGTRLGLRELGNRPVLVGRDAVSGPGQKPGE